MKMMGMGMEAQAHQESEAQSEVLVVCDLAKTKEGANTTLHSLSI
jgi:hypothetical protein